jgi:RecB family exonuclease
MPFHVSPSQIRTWLSCPYSWYLDKVLHAERSRVVKPAREAGSALHDVSAAVRDLQLDVGGHSATHPDYDLARVFADVYKDLPAELTAAPEFQKMWSDAQLVGLPWYCREYLPGKTTLLSEGEQEAEIPGSDYTMVTRMDWVYAQDQVLGVSDSKFGRKPSGLDSDLQLTIYAWMVGEKCGRLPDVLEFVHTPSVGKKTRATADKPAGLADPVLRTTRTVEQIDATFSAVVYPAIAGMRRCRETLQPPPANPEGKFGCAGCDFRALCPVGGAGGDEEEGE